MRPSDAVWTGDVDGLGRVGEGRGEGMVGSAVSPEADWEFWEGRRAASDGYDREVSNARSIDVRVGVAASTVVASMRGDLRSPDFLDLGGDGGWSSMGGRRGTSIELRIVREGGRGVLWS